MKQYSVKIPLAGFYEITIDAHSSHEAGQKALQANVAVSIEGADYCECKSYYNLTGGGSFIGPLHKVEIKQLCQKDD